MTIASLDEKVMYKDPFYPAGGVLMTGEKHALVAGAYHSTSK